MQITRRSALALLAGAIPLMTAGPSQAAGITINVSLWDRGENAMMELDPAKPLGMGMMKGAMPMGPMGVTVDTTSVPAGEITFRATNDSKVMVHEMVVSPVPANNAPLPYIASEEKVDEDKAGHVGEVAELEPGKAGALTITLKPGTYILYCNIPGHYVLGMWTLVTVTG